METLQQKVYSFSLDQKKDFTLSQQKVIVKVNGETKEGFSAKDLFEKISTIGGNIIKGYSHLQGSILKNGAIIFNGLEITLWNENKEQLCIYEIRDPQIKMNNFQSKTSEEDFVKSLQNSLETIVNSKFDFLKEKEYKQVKFTANNGTILFCYLPENEVYLFALVDGKLAMDEAIEEITNADDIIQYQSGFGFNFIYMKSTSKIAIV